MKYPFANVTRDTVGNCLKWLKNYLGCIMQYFSYSFLDVRLFIDLDTIFVSWRK